MRLAKKLEVKVIALPLLCTGAHLGKADMQAVVDIAVVGIGYRL